MGRAKSFSAGAPGHEFNRRWAPINADFLCLHLRPSAVNPASSPLKDFPTTRRTQECYESNCTAWPASLPHLLDHGRGTILDRCGRQQSLEQSQQLVARRRAAGWVRSEVV